MAITKLAFSALADQVRIKVGDAMLYGKPKAGTSEAGNVGFHGNGKVAIKLPSVSLSEWKTAMKPIKVKVGDTELDAKPGISANGNAKWHFNGKVPIELSTGDLTICQVGGDVTVIKSKDMAVIEGLQTCQVGCNITVLGSKHWADGEERPTSTERGESFTITKDDVATIGA